jgi:hypothetical protein
MRIQRLLEVLVVLLLVGCEASSPNSAVDIGMIDSLRTTEGIRSLDGGSLEPRAVLFVDATCQNSLYALEQALLDSSLQKQIALHYFPQTARDPVARFETTALECSRRLGAMREYVTQRLDDAVRRSRSVSLSAFDAGIDTARFSACITSPEAVAHVEGHETLANAARL